MGRTTAHDAMKFEVTVRYLLISFDSIGSLKVMGSAQVVRWVMAAVVFLIMSCGVLYQALLC